jgi:polyisoprenyl-phosphate glycosyltransferase
MSPVQAVDRERGVTPTSANTARLAVEEVLPLPFPLAARDLKGRRVCIVVPAFNEEPSLPALHHELSVILDDLGVDATILFVNDGSRDGTVAVLERLCAQDPRVGYVLLARNFGHQAALTAGLDHAEGDVVISMDADLQHPPEVIRSLLAAWAAGYDVVHTRKLATEGLTRWRRIVTRLAYRTIGRVARVEIIPQASDFRLIDRTALEVVRSLPEHTRLYRGLTVWIGFRQGVLPYAAAARFAGTSQYGFRQLFQLFSRSLLDFSSFPLYLALWLGSALLAVGAFGLAIVGATSLGEAREASPWVVMLLAVALLTGVTWLLVGLLGVYMARIYDEVRARPTYVTGRFRAPGSASATSR